METRDIMVGENNAKRIIEFIMELDIEVVVDIPGSYRYQVKFYTC